MRYIFYNKTKQRKQMWENKNKEKIIKYKGLAFQTAKNYRLLNYTKTKKSFVNQFIRIMGVYKLCFFIFHFFIIKSI